MKMDFPPRLKTKHDNNPYGSADAQGGYEGWKSSKDIQSPQETQDFVLQLIQI